MAPRTSQYDRYAQKVKTPVAPLSASSDLPVNKERETNEQRVERCDHQGTTEPSPSSRTSGISAATRESFLSTSITTEAHTEPEEIMNKLKMFATTALAAATIGVGGLVAAPSASAMPMSCDRALALAQAYIVIGNMLRNGGHYQEATYYFGKAEGVIDAAC
jgi:hypothetical protein